MSNAHQPANGRKDHPPYADYNADLVRVEEEEPSLYWSLRNPDATGPYLGRMFFTGQGDTVEANQHVRVTPSEAEVRQALDRQEAKKPAEANTQQTQGNRASDFREASQTKNAGPTVEGYAPFNARHDELWFSDLYNLSNPELSNAKAVSRSCIMCNAWNAALCQTCKSAHYCSPECQRLDWPLHKLLCKSIVKMGEPPSDTKVRALHFQHDEPQPVVAFGEAGFRGEEWRSASRDYMQTALALYQRTVRVTRNPIRGRTLFLGNGTKSLLLVRPDDAEEMPENGSLKAAAEKATIQPILSKWRGSFTVFRELVGNVTLRDFRDVMDYLGWYRPNPVVEQRMPFNVPFPVSLPFGTDFPAHGVKIASTGEEARHKVAQPALIPERHPMRKGEGIPSTFFHKLGSSVFLRRTGRPLDNKRSTEEGSLSNDNAALLCIDLDPDSATWTDTPTTDFENAGTVLVVRADGALLASVEVRDVIDWIKEVMQPKMKLAMKGSEGESTSSAKRSACLDLICWESISAFAMKAPRYNRDADAEE